MGTSHRSWWSGRQRHGFGQYFMGTSPWYMLASAAYRMTRPPRVVGGVAMLYGYFKSMVQRNPRYGDAEFWRSVRALPARQAQAVALFYLEDYSVRDIAAVLDCSEGTVKTHLSRARTAVARQLRLERVEDGNE